MIMDKDETLVDLDYAAKIFIGNVDTFTQDWQIGMQDLGWPKLQTMDEWQAQFDSWLSLLKAI